MSRIYDALTKTGSSTDSILQKIRAEQESQTATLIATPPPAMAPASTIAEPSAEMPAPVEDYRRVTIALAPGSPLFPFDGSNDRAAEQYRIVRTNILRHPKRPKVIAISSGSSGDGKTVSSINITSVLALKSETQVLLIDADLRHRAIGEFLGINSRPGLTEVLGGQATPEEAIVRLQQLPTMCVLPGGGAIDNPTELLDSVAWRDLIAHMRERFGFVVIDSTPVGAFADYAQAEHVADGVIMMIRPDHTNRKICNEALQGISPDKFLGSVVNDAPDWFASRAGEGYYYSRE